MPKGGLSYESKEACILDAKRKGMSDAPCANLPSNAATKKKSPKDSPSLMGGPKKMGNTMPQY